MCFPFFFTIPNTFLSLGIKSFLTTHIKLCFKTACVKEQVPILITYKEDMDELNMYTV